MADDLVERLRIKADMIHLGETIAWGSDVALMHEAVARITDLEASLAAAEAGEDALANTGENLVIAIGMGWDLEGVIDAFKDALAALDARINAAKEEGRIMGLREGAEIVRGGCPECRGTGQRDTGGTYPWGEGIFMACDCTDAILAKIKDANHE